jgi:hypothetical protein
MVRKQLWIAAGLLLSLSTAVVAGSLAGAPVVFKSGNWKVLRVTDNMTDQKSCVGIYKDDYGIQLSPGTLYIRVQGGPQGYRFRFDEDQPEGLRLATDIQRKIDTVEVSGTDYNRLIKSHRLRYSVSTILGHEVEGDLDLTGIEAAAENVANNCPGDEQAPPSKPAASGCSDAVRERMKAKGMNADEIDGICKA